MDNKAVLSWTTGRSASIAKALALRCALRVVAFDGYDPIDDDHDECGFLRLASATATFISWVAQRWPDRNMDLIAAQAAGTADDLADLTDPDGEEGMEDLPQQTFDRLCAAANVGRAAAAAARSVDSAFLPSLAASQAAHFGSEVVSGASFDAIFADGKWLAKYERSHPDAGEFLANPLWLEIEEPEALSAEWDIAKAKWSKLNEGWDIWVEWYELRRMGSRLAWNGLSPEEHEILCLGLANKRTEFWKRQPAEVNGEIARLVTAARQSSIQQRT